MKRRRQPFVFVVPCILATLLVLSRIESIECSIIDYNFDRDLMPSDLIEADGFVSIEATIKTKLNINLTDVTSISIDFYNKMV